MRRLFTGAALLLMLTAAPSLFANDRIEGWCEDGNYTVSVPGGSGPSSNKYQRSFPQCTVTVYTAGTVTLATIYSDNSGTAQANPFTASSAGRWFFYAANGRYDVRMSGSGISAPFTLGDNLSFDERITIGYNVRTYGALGNGTTVDDTAFTNAIAAAKADSRILYIPQGVYRLSTPVMAFVNNGVTNDSGFVVICEAPNDRWRSGIYPVRIDYRGTGQAISLSASNNSSLTSITIRGCQFDGRNLTASTAVDGMLLTAATAGSSIDGIRVEDSAFTNFPQYQVHVVGTVFDAYFDSPTLQNPNQVTGAGNLFEVESTAAGQITLNNPWLVQYTTGKWNVFAGRNAGFPSNAVSDFRIIGGSITGYDTVSNIANGANGVWVHGGLTILGTHMEDGCECNHPRSIGVRYTGSNSAVIAPSNASFWGTGVELGNSGNEVGGSALLTGTESVGATIEGGVGFNNNCIVPITCSDVRVVGGAGARSGTFININGIYTTSGNFGTATGDPLVFIDTTASATNANNVLRATRTAATGGYPAFGALFFDQTNSRVAIGAGAYAPALKFNVHAAANDGFRLNNTSNFGNTTVQIISDGTNNGEVDLFTSGGTKTGQLNGSASGSSYLPNIVQALGFNYILTESGANSAIAGTLANVTFTVGTAGTCLYIKLAHTLTGGAGNTFNFNGGGAIAIKSSRNTANNIATGYANTAVFHTCYDGTNWLDMSQ